MLNDAAAIDDINPFVLHDFSLPGGVRQTGDFQDFQEIPPSKGIPEPTKKVYFVKPGCVRMRGLRVR